MKNNARAFDVAVIGGGIVGASIAHALAGHCRVLLLEAEDSNGYHATGRSAALYAPSYGPPSVRALTRASRGLFESAPGEFCANPILTPRGALFVGTAEQRDDVARLHAQLTAERGGPALLDAAAARALVPVLRKEAAASAVYDRQALEIDVDQLLQSFLRGARISGTELRKTARVVGLVRRGNVWTIKLESGESTAVPIVVNAAGAWVDKVAALAGVAPIGIEPRRRSAFLFDPPGHIPCQEWPAVIAIDESWYFKPDAGLLLGSPANADRVAAHDVVAEDIDIATGIYRIEEATTLSITRPRTTWAGLRSFVADGEPVCGFDGEHPQFFWAAAVGGYGIQSAPAFGRLCASLILGNDLPSDIASEGLEPSKLSPAREGLVRG